MKIRLTKPFVDKLESISYDIKYYININVVNSPDDLFNLMDEDEIQELIEIRGRIKSLHYKLKEKLKE